MLLKRNLFEYLTIISCSGSVFCILLNYIINISPLTGIWFSIYTLVVFFISLVFSVKYLQWLLHLNKPLKYDLDALTEKYPYLSFVSSVLPKPRHDKSTECAEYDTNQLSVISTVLERKLVSSWYVPYISQEIGFPFACKQMLDQMIGRTFQICHKIETKEIYIDICSILISHLKEYKKAIKRHEKAPSSTIESHYKKTHPISGNSDKKYQSADHCTNILRIILKELVPWELWDTPHSELLVRILSKKLDNFIDDTLANPIWLNDKLLTILKGKTETESESVTEDINQYNSKVDGSQEEIPKEEIMGVPQEKVTIKPETPTIESALSTLITKSTAPILQRPINEVFTSQLLNEKIEDIAEETDLKGSDPVEIKSSPVLRQRRGRQGRNEVKIYDRIIEGSVKTWDTDVDLQCISLGQDLLASLNGEITLSRLWGHDPTEPDGGKNEQSLWFGEEDNLDMELTDTSPKNPSPVKKEHTHSPKPAELLKDLQTTVHQAKTKIGDLQVSQIDVRNHDEAAGMMEGLLDFGIAGLKKGLRLTGLSDQDKSPSHQHHKEKIGDKSSPPLDLIKTRPVNQTVEVKELITSTVIQKEDNGVSSVPHLVKQQRIASQDSLPSQAKPIVRGDFPAPLLPLPDSPEPEYEEAADLSTSIAKLRCLLEQRAEISPSRSEEIWWEGAEETRGRTQNHRSSRPVDTATLADEYDMNADRNTSPGQMTNNMQRLDKLFHRTVTGVFNSIKTAVGGDADADAAASAGAGETGLHPLPEWTYVCTSVELSVGGAVARLVGSRRAFNHVDAALDSLDQLAAPPTRKEVMPEDFEEWCASLGGGWCGCAELASAAGVCRSHVAYRIATLLCADLAESLINAWLEDLTSWLRNQVFVVFEEMAQESPDSGLQKKRRMREFNIDETSAAVIEKIPVTAMLLGEETVSKAVRLSISSVSHKEVNKDVIFRLLDVFAMHFKKSAGVRNPSFDNN